VTYDSNVHSNAQKVTTLERNTLRTVTATARQYMPQFVTPGAASDVDVLTDLIVASALASYK
jgi:hypothetical protein